MRAPLSLKIGAASSSSAAESNPASGVTVVVVGSVVGGWRLVVVAETRLFVVVADGAVSLAREPRRNTLSGKVGMSVRKVSQVSEAEPDLLEIGDAS